VPADCESFLRQTVDVPASLVDYTCDIWATQASSGKTSVDAPTVAFAWTDVGAVSTDGVAGVAGWPISATCLITGAITGPNTAYYVLAGVANTAGPASSTTIRCTASPAGLSVNQTLPGPTSAGADFTSTIPGSALTAQRICSFAEAYYLIRPLYMKTGTLPCSIRV
jgi:hypothetical protein